MIVGMSPWILSGVGTGGAIPGCQSMHAAATHFMIDCNGAYVRPRNVRYSNRRYRALARGRAHDRRNRRRSVSRQPAGTRWHRRRTPVAKRTVGAPFKLPAPGPASAPAPTPLGYLQGRPLALAHKRHAQHQTSGNQRRAEPSVRTNAVIVPQWFGDQRAKGTPNTDSRSA